MRKAILALGAAGAFAAGSIATTHAATLTGSQLTGLGAPVNCGTCSGSNSGGTITLTSSDNVGGGGLPQFQNTSTIFIPSGYSGTTTLGTLNNFLTNYASGVSFDLKTATAAGGQYAYWNVELTTTVSSTTYTAVLNAFGDNALGANAWNANTSQGYDNLGNKTTYGFGSTWATAAGTSLDGVALGSWTITALSISTGGWNTGTTQTDTIDSITLPGTLTVSQTPLPATLPLFATGLGALGLLARRRKRKGIPAAS